MTVLGNLELIEDIAAEIGVAESTIREWCRRGEFPHTRYPGKRRIFVPRAWVDSYLAGNCELDVKRLANGGRIVKPRTAKVGREAA